MLAAQARYGRHLALSGVDGLSLGRYLYPLLPEDAFDHGPVWRDNMYLAADVRLDNREELGAALDIAPSSIARFSDAMLLFECLMRWGQAATARLVGEFAFAFWNGAEQTLILARDYLGFRPLYFHRGADFFAFSSMPSGLHAIPEIPYDFDAEEITRKLALIARHGRKSFFREIERVEPATMLIVTPSDIHT